MLKKIILLVICFLSPALFAVNATDVYCPPVYTDNPPSDWQGHKFPGICGNKINKIQSIKNQDLLFTSATFNDFGDIGKYGFCVYTDQNNNTSKMLCSSFFMNQHPSTQGTLWDKKSTGMTCSSPQHPEKCPFPKAT